LFGKWNVHDVNLLSVSQRVLMDYNWQAIGLVAGHNWHDDFGRGQANYSKRDGSNHVVAPTRR